MRGLRAGSTTSDSWEEWLTFHKALLLRDGAGSKLRASRKWKRRVLLMAARSRCGYAVLEV